MGYSNSPLADYIRISPNKTVNRNHAIDTVSIHCVVGQTTVERLGEIFAPISRKASSNYGIGPDGRIGMYVEEKDRSWCTSSASNDHRAITIEVASDNTHPYAVTDKAYTALIELLADICKRNGIKQLLWKGDKSLIGKVDQQNMTVHRWFANKSCPGEYLYSRHGQIAAEVNARLDGMTVAFAPPAYDKQQFIRDIQAAIGAKADGIAGSETLSKTVTVSKSKNNRHAVVRPLQDYLNTLGYPCGTADGIAGPKFDAAVKAYQKAHACIADGELTAGKRTWQSLLGMV